MVSSLGSSVVRTRIMDIQQQGRVALPPENPDDTIDLRALLSAVLRGKYILILGLIFGAGLGIANVIATTPLFSASTTVRISSPDVASEREISGGTSGNVDDITTELLVLRSDRIATRVVDDLALADDEAFFTPPQTGISRTIGFAISWGMQGVNYAKELIETQIGGPQIQPDVPAEAPNEEAMAEARRNFAISVLRGSMSVSQVQGGRVLSIRYTSASPNLSIRIANGIADAYIEEQISSKFEATQRATDWLGEQAEQLREQAIRLDQEVEIFRRENNLLDIGGDTLSSTELERLNQRVADARASILDLVTITRFWVGLGQSMSRPCAAVWNLMICKRSCLKRSNAPAMSPEAN